MMTLKEMTEICLRVPRTAGKYSNCDSCSSDLREKCARIQRLAGDKGYAVMAAYADKDVDDILREFNV